VPPPPIETASAGAQRPALPPGASDAGNGDS
jgi:hypothetical protein